MLALLGLLTVVALFVLIVTRTATPLVALIAEPAFKARGGKLIMYTGLANPVTSPFDTIAYYESVAKAIGGLDATRSFYRFFPAPGMAHCGGGAGPNTFDALAALDTWVERGHRAGLDPRFARDQRPDRSHAPAVRISGCRTLQG